ncbi:Nitrate excretion transporter 1 [Acorus calamus]|uniref:Nitrate excretion transporter 1 n=1 Tax=Acorus calamus TaxID=4465 RepID=A0AAV9EHW7_ACOCL|nr:Nitrate excretion transporter 1 [Acorus calamus]
MTLFTLTASLPSLHPHQCPNAPSTATCGDGPSTGQMAVLYSALALMVIGTGDSHFTNVTMGANQFSTTWDQDVFFNWFFNPAAIQINGDTNLDGTVAKPWRLATVEQVEDLKTLIKMFPLWSSSILISVTVGIQLSMTVLQALKMDRHIGRTFSVPPVGSALVEQDRLRSITAHGPGLLPPLVVVGVGEALHFPGQVGLYYQEFPEELWSTSTAMIALTVGIGFYLSTAVVDLVKRTTGWLPDDINAGRVDKVYWMLAVVGMINFCYYVVCARLYKYQNKNKEGVGSEASDTLSTKVEVL